MSSLFNLRIRLRMRKKDKCQGKDSLVIFSKFSKSYTVVSHIIENVDPNEQKIQPGMTFPTWKVKL